MKLYIFTILIFLLASCGGTQEYFPRDKYPQYYDGADNSDVSLCRGLGFKENSSELFNCIASRHKLYYGRKNFALRRNLPVDSYM